MNVTGPVSAAGGANTPASALAGVPADIRNVLTTIATSPGITEADRTSLVKATAVASGISDASLRSVALKQISGMGLYLSSVGDNSLPRWSVMTALRAYGLNIRDKTPTESDTTRTAQAMQQVAALAKANNISVTQAITHTPGAGTAPKPTPLQSKNAAVTAGLFGGTEGSPATLTTTLLNRLV